MLGIVGNRTLYSIFLSQANQHPEREWLVYERADGQVERYTYGAFLQRVHQAARLLANLGVTSGSVFNLHLSNQVAHPELMLAASCIGAIAMPSNPASSADELQYLLDHSESKVIFTEASALATVEKVAAGRGIILCETGETLPSGYPIYGVELARLQTDAPSYVGKAQNVVELLYTSGTTSRPKGVMLTNASLIYGAEVFRAATGLRDEERHLVSLPLFHAAAQCHGLLPSLIAGASAALMSRFSASRFFDQARQYGCTRAALFAAPLRMLLNQPERADDADHPLRSVTFAMSLTEAQYATWHRRFRVPLQQLWGMTETVGLPLMSPISGDRRLAAMGRPVPGYDVRVVDEVDQDVPVGQPGQLIVRGVPGYSMMLGYLKNSEATALTLRQHDDGIWLYTGDTVDADEDGFLYFIDRGKDLIKRAGENVSSTQIESVIRKCSGVQDVCVVSLPDELRDEKIVAVIVTPEGGVTEDVIRAHCQEYLAAFKVPEIVIFTESLPRTSVGKVQKNLVREWIQLQRLNSL